jgi:hypothetical protein
MRSLGWLALSVLGCGAPLGLYPYATGGAYYAASNRQPTNPGYQQQQQGPQQAPEPIAPAPPAQVQAVAIFDPPPGPITDSCAELLNRRMAVRQAALALQPPNPSFVRKTDDGIRAVWAACQDRYLAQHTAPPEISPSQDGAEFAPEPEPPAAPVAPPPPAAAPAPPEESQAPPPREVKLTAAQRQAAAEREAKRKEERAKKKAEKTEHDRQEALASENAAAAYCGNRPDRSAWDGLYDGLERYFKSIANDPDSVDFAGCTDMVLKGLPVCWLTKCNVRAKNPFGAKILRTMTFSKSVSGWQAYEK